MPDKDFSARNEALLALNSYFKSTKSAYERAQCLASVAQIELLAEIVRRLDRLPISAMSER